MGWRLGIDKPARKRTSLFVRGGSSMSDQSQQEVEVVKPDDASTCSAKYIFLDVVGFTNNRSVEAQTDIVRAMNRIVLSVINRNRIAQESYLFIPTGDGICIALMNTEAKYVFDIHIRIALGLLESLDEYNEQQSDELRKFQIRIGINANEDNLVEDINGRTNLAGAGISFASRIMDLADGCQILVGESVFDRLQQREKYMEQFSKFNAHDKHGRSFRVYQYVDKSSPGLSVETPAVFRRESEQAHEVKLSPLVAYFLAYAIRNRATISKTYKQFAPDGSVMEVLLYLLAQDTYALATETDSKLVGVSTWKFGEATFEEQIEYYRTVDHRVISLPCSYPPATK